MQTRRYTQELVPVGQDSKGTRHTLTVLANVSRPTAGTPRGGPNGLEATVSFASGADALIGLRDQLMTPRRPLRFDVGNRTFVNITAANRAGVPAEAALDVELGPKPLSCNVVGFNGPQNVMVEYSIQWTVRAECADADNLAVLAHAWKGEDEISEDYYLTRVYTGVIQFNALVVGPGSGMDGIHPDRLRRLLLPPRTPGTHRKSVNVRNLEDGYTMAYRVVDQQPHAFVNSRAVSRIEATHAITVTKPSRQEILAARAEMANAIAGGAVRVAGVPGGVFGDPDPERKDPRGSIAMNVERYGNIAGGLAGAVWGGEAASYNGIPMAVHSFEATAYGTPAALYAELARAARTVCLYRLMRGTLIGAQGLTLFGGRCEQFDSTTPKSTTVRLVMSSRPSSMERGQEDVRWAQGNNTMPTVVGNNLINRPITSEQNQPIPRDVQQLMYEASIQGAPGDWGWVDAAFAPDLMSTRDADVRDDGLFPRQSTATPLQLMLIAELQDPCDYKSRQGLVFNNTAPLQRLPT